MELVLKITCNMQLTPLVATIAPKICTGGFFNMLDPNLPLDLLSDHSRNTSFKPKLLA